MYSALTLLPDRRSGFVLLTNGEGSDARTVLSEVLLKRFTAAAENHRVAEYADAVARDAKAPVHKAPDTSSRTPLPVAAAQRVLGVWRDPWFGKISICARDGTVRFASDKSPLLAGSLARVGQRVLIDWDDDRVDAEAWLDPDDGAKATRLAMAKVDPDADFSFDFEDLEFTREHDCD
jgi:hypothetical protein